MEFGSALYWRETHRQPKFLIFDGRIVIILMLSVMHIKAWTVGLSIFAIAALWFFERKGVRADSIFRFLRASLVGRKRSARGLDAERMPVDFSFETEADVASMRLMMAGRHKAFKAKEAKRAAKQKKQSAKA